MRGAYRILLPAFLLVLWLVLNESWSLAQFFLGVVLALWFTWAAARLRPLHAKPHKLWLLPGLFCKVATDIIRSNFAVACLILHPQPERYTPGFIRIPLTLRDPHGLAMLACILTYTPGTVWVDFARDGYLTVHVLDLQNEAEWVRWVKQHYERPLMEIFE
jgi:multicomponent K+:H+ antiporter subunit E